MGFLLREVTVTGNLLTIVIAIGRGHIAAVTAINYLLKVVATFRKPDGTGI